MDGGGSKKRTYTDGMNAPMMGWSESTSGSLLQCCNSLSTLINRSTTNYRLYVLERGLVHDDVLHCLPGTKGTFVCCFRFVIGLAAREG